MASPHQKMLLCIESHFRWVGCKVEGSVADERELCAQLGVGRASLREALKALEIMGMIETRVGDGTYACEPFKSQSFSAAS